MKKWLFKNPQFVKTAIFPKHYPQLKDPQGRPLAEIVVAGRSNVGKSSLLNHLFGSKDLVKTSATPGKTQAINFFLLNEQLVFVDLPGYGYAKVPDEVKRQWGPMVESYLQGREELKLILFLLDIRRLPNQEDHQFLAWARARGVPLILVLTKVDKVSLSERKKNREQILKSFHCENFSSLYYTVSSAHSRDELIRMISKVLNEE